MRVSLVARSVVVVRHVRGLRRDVAALSAVLALLLVQVLTLGVSLPATLEAAPSCGSLKALRALQLEHLRRSGEYWCR